MLKYILAFIVIVVVWVGWFFLSGYIEANIVWIPIVITVLIFLLLLTLFIVRRLRARRAARQLEKALAEQAAEHARTARPDLQAEILEMQAEFEKATASLKSSKLGRGTDALYALPWQIIIGPPGAGKTTALRNSGLQFPYLSKKTGGAIQGVGGTRNCDWWLTNEAVILDTAGRWATEEEDRDEWFGFLDLVAKFRTRKPLNGIIAAVSIADLGGATEHEVAEVAQKMRERIDEAMTRLKMSLPVYVLFTKCDLIPGFVEMYGNMSKNDRGQIWGFTVPMAKSDSAMEHFDSRFDQLVSSVETRALQRMGQERRIETREMIHMFPNQLGVLKQNLSAFVGQMFEENVFQETPVFRGVYFTSGTQEGSPIDRVMNRMAEAFGVQAQIPEAHSTTTPKSYFLVELFRKVIFQDADLAVRSEAEMRRQRFRRYIFAGVMFLLAFLLLTIPAISWFSNSGRLSNTERVVANAEKAISAAKRDVPLNPDVLDDLNTEVKAYRAGPLAHQRAGMYPGDSVKPDLDNFYNNSLKRHVAKGIFDEDELELDRFGREFLVQPDARLPADVHQLNHDRLRAHLLMTPRQEGEPELVSGDSLSDEGEILSQHLADAWASKLKIPPTSDRAKGMRRHTDEFVKALGTDSNMPFPRNEKAVKRVRVVLNRVNSINLAVDGFVAEFPGHLTLRDMMGGTVGSLRDGGHKIRRAFTKEAWDGTIRERLKGSLANLTGESWVLGSEAAKLLTETARAEKARREVREAYLKQYVNEWENFLKGLKAVSPDSNDQAYEIMQEVCCTDPTPLQRLWNNTKDNLTLVLPSKGTDSATAGSAAAIAKQELKRITGRSRAGKNLAKLAGGAAADAARKATELTPERVPDRFKGFLDFGIPGKAPEGQPAPETDLDGYENDIQAVRNALKTYMDDDSDQQALDSAILEGRAKVSRLIDSQQTRWRQTFKQLLWPPVEGMSKTHTKGVAGGKGRSYCQEVYEPYQRTIGQAYPFDANGQDMSVEDFAAFYGPTGTIWTFYDEVLKAHINREGDDFSFARRLGRPTGFAYEAELLDFLQRSRDITQTYFGAGEEPAVEFDVRIRPSPHVATQELSINGETFEYHNGPEQWHRFAWPGEDPVAGATIEVRGAAGMHERVQQEGEWGLYHLLERGTVTAGAGRRVFTVVWHLCTHNVDITMDFRPTRANTPFFGVVSRERAPGLMQPVRADDVEPPQRISAQGTPCRGRPVRIARRES